MFLLALVYLIILVVAAIGYFWPDPRAVRIGGFAQWVLFVIIGIVLFWSVLNKG
jgi:hypothetical protein